MSSKAISKSAGARSRRVRACNHCRQFKIRCDSAEVFPAPCSACKAKGRECHVDSSFKPIRTRSLLRDVTAQLAQIQETLKGHDITIPRPSLPLDSPYGAHVEPSPASVEPPRIDNSPAAPETLPSTVSSTVSTTGSSNCKDDITSIGNKRLGDITLEPEAIRDLFDHFRRNHFSYFPILDEDFGASELAQSCPLLFWTIIVISSRHHTQHSCIYPGLLAPYTEILSKALVQSIDSIHVIQAILYICLWPLRNNDGHNGDPSFNYSGIAVNAALRLRLHSPSLETGENRSHGRFYIGDRDERTRTWRGCIYLSTQ
ncbi:hypothetical protein V1525DRAFT_437847, partial [Lipomyces kononenkoae]